MNSFRFHIFWTLCTSHCIDVMFKVMGKRKAVKAYEARTVMTFIYNHGYVFTLMREKCGGDIVHLGFIQFATNYIAL